MLLFDVKAFKPKDDLFIICYNLKEPDNFWVFPSKVFRKYAYYLKKYNKYRLILGDERSKKRRELFSFLNNFYPLLGEAERPAVVLGKTKSGWWWLKKNLPSVSAVDKRIEEVKKRGGGKKYIKVLECLRRYWEKRGVR